MVNKAKHDRFIEEYLKDFNGAQAAIRAGYSKKTAHVQASQLLAKPNIRAAVEAGQERLREETRIDQRWVIKRLVENHDRAAQAEPVLDREGNETGEYVYQGNVVNKSLELLGRHLGMFVERHEIEAHVTHHDSRESVLDRISSVEARLGSGSNN